MVCCLLLKEFVECFVVNEIDEFGWFKDLVIIELSDVCLIKVVILGYSDDSVSYLLLDM